MMLRTILRASITANLGSKAFSVHEIPKKPANSFLLFYKDNFIRGKRKEIAALWNRLNHEKRKEYVEKANQLKQDYHAKLATIPDEVLKESERRKQLQKQKSRKAATEYLKKLGYPTPPLHQFLRFYRQKLIADCGSEESYRDRVKRISREWSELDNNSRLLYRIEYEAAFEQYQLRLTEWREKVFRDGFPKDAPSDAIPALIKEFMSLNCPKPPIPVYARFFKERSKDGEFTTDRNRRLSEEWKRMDSAAKQPYREQYRKEREEYESKMLEWRKKVVEIGPPNGTPKAALHLFKPLSAVEKIKILS